MNRFEVVSPTGITISSGILQLDKSQAASRAFALSDLGKGLYQVNKPVQFKRGEVFGYDGPLPKAFADQLQDVDKKAAKKAAKE